MELKYKVDGQNVKAMHNIEPVAGSKGYLTMLFDYIDTADTAWNNLAVVCEFSNSYDFRDSCATVVKDGKCNIPDEVTDKTEIYFRLYGRTKDLNGTIITERTLLKQRR